MFKRMNVLLLGCTSGIGQSITKIFSPNNNLILVGRSNKTLNEMELPKTIRIGAILRNKTIIIPNSETMFKENDDVVFFSETASVKQLEKLLSIRQQFS